jgi:hypothetical protein
MEVGNEVGDLFCLIYTYWVCINRLFGQFEPAKMEMFFFFFKTCKQMVRKWRFMVVNVTFNNISVISWWSVLLVEETGGPVENHRPFAT